MYEDDTGLIYMRARYYSPELRRFINADKVHGDISNALSLNRYAFCNGNPASNVDPMGLSAERVGVGTSMGARFGISETTRRRIYNEAIRKYRKLHPVGKINVEEVLKILKELAPPRRNVEKNYLPYTAIDTDSAVYLDKNDINLIPADENSEFGYVEYENELYPIKYLDYANKQTYLKAFYHVAAQCYYSSETDFSFIRASTGFHPEGLPEATDRVMYSKNGIRLQSTGIGNNKNSNKLITGSVAVSNGLSYFQNGLEERNLIVDILADSSGVNRVAKIYSYTSYIYHAECWTEIKDINYIYHGIDENGNIFVVG